MVTMKKLIKYFPLLIPIIGALIMGWILLGNCYGYTISYDADYLWTIAQINIPQKDLKIYLLDTRQGIVKIFSDYIIINNIPIRNYAIAGVRISSEQVLELATFNTLTQAKQKAKNYALTHNINLTWKQHIVGQKISDWWGKATIQ